MFLMALDDQNENHAFAYRLTSSGGGNNSISNPLFMAGPIDLAIVLADLLESGIYVKIRTVPGEGLQVVLYNGPDLLRAKAMLSTRNPARLSAWLVEAARHYYPESKFATQYPEGLCPSAPV